MLYGPRIVFRMLSNPSLFVYLPIAVCRTLRCFLSISNLLRILLSVNGGAKYPRLSSVYLMRMDMYPKYLTIVLSVLAAYMVLRMTRVTQSASKPLASGIKDAIPNPLAPGFKDTIPNPRPFPTFFFSHGGPTFIYENDDFGDKGAWRTVKKIGQTIKNEYKPDYIVVVSAHWQLSGSKLIEVAVPLQKAELAENELIYDFHGFPKHMYREEFHTNNSRFVSEEILLQLKKAGFISQLTKRGIDHGVWVPFKVAFSDYNTLEPLPEGAEHGLDLPETSLIQVSLTGLDRDFDTHFELGKALNHFRQNMIWDPIKEKYLKGLVICSGMSVHNLRELGLAASTGRTMPYTKKFHELLREKMVPSKDILGAFKEIKSEHTALLYKAHPTLEHFVPLVVAGGIVSEKSESIKELYNSESLSFGWNVYQFGDY